VAQMVVDFGFAERLIAEVETMRISEHHLGIGFAVWNAQESWFWLVANSDRNGVIGAAATESEAMREARSSIEELSDTIVLSSWERSLGNLERYLASVCDTRA
jgi:hypothetical protein